MAWHSAGTYRIGDGRGGAGSGYQRFAPLNSWPDNANLDKARRLLWPIKQKYGKKISWADLMILAGNCALGVDGLQDLRLRRRARGCLGAGRGIYWGNEASGWATSATPVSGSRESPRRCADGPDLREPGRAERQPGSARRRQDIRETFARMAMNDEETVALIAGGHTFGKTHGAGLRRMSAQSRKAAGIEEQGLGWKSSFGSGKGGDTITSGLEVTWTSTPTKWSSNFFWNLFGYEWELTKSPAGAHQWMPKHGAGAGSVPDAHDPSKRHAPAMLTTDLALRFDPAYEKISRRFYENPDQFADAFARAWFKLTHRDMGPRVRYLGPEVPAEELIWQDPLPGRSRADRRGRTSRPSRQNPGLGLSISQLVSTAWASASTFRGSDKRGGANGARIRLAPQKDWEVNQPANCDGAETLEGIQRSSTARSPAGRRFAG
jgi:catalase-peroxidase